MLVPREDRDNLVNIALEQLPELREGHDEEDGSYILFGSLAIYFQEHIENDGLSEDFLSRAFKLLNWMANHWDPDTQNVFTVGFTEVACDSEKVRDLLKQRLCPKGLKLMEDIISFWWGDNPPRSG